MALSLRNLKIRQQIMLVTLPPIFVLLCGIGVLFYAYWIAHLSDRSIRSSEESIARGERVLRLATEMHAGVRAFLLTRDPAQLAPFTEDSALIREELATLRELKADDPARVAKTKALEVEINRFINEWARPAVEKVQRGEVAEVDTLVAEGERQKAAVRTRIFELLRADEADNLALIVKSELAMRHMLELGVGLGAVLAGILFFLTQVMTRVIALPVKQLIDASDSVSRGEFRFSLPPPSRNEFGILSQSFTHMTSALKRDREELAALNKFSEAATQCTTESEIYDHVLHSLRERFQPRQVIIFRLNQAENFLEAAVTLAPLPDSLSLWPVIEEPHDCKAVRMGRRFAVNDVEREPLCSAKFAPPSEGSYCCSPLIAGGVIIGAVRLEGSKGLWTPERESLLESYLSVAASALSNLRLLQTMKKQANIDELTGLYNRRFLEDYARKLIAMAARKGTPLGIIMLDLDHFKNFNDEFGHEVGDRVLRQFSKTVTQAMRETNLAARYGGEEFVVLLPDTGAQYCMLVAERIRHAVERMVVPAGTEKPLPQITVSLGVAIYPEHAKTLEELLLASDKALYESKRAGRNRSTVYMEQQAEHAT